MAETSVLLSNLFDSKTVEVLKKLLRKDDIFYLRDISRESGISLATTYRIVKKLIPLGLVMKEQQGKFTIYKLLKNTPIYSELFNLIVGTPADPLQILRQEMDKTYKGNYDIYAMKGSDNKIVIIGDSFDKQIVNLALQKVYNDTKIQFNAMLVTKDQFDSMKAMGLIK